MKKTTTTTTKQQTALECYTARMNEIKATLKAINEALATHESSMLTEPRNWGYAGDLGECTRYLKNALASVGGASDED